MGIIKPFRIKSFKKKNPLIEFTKIAKYVENLTQMQFDNKKIEKAIEATSFEKLENLEKKGLFSENTETCMNKKALSNAI